MFKTIIKSILPNKLIKFVRKKRNELFSIEAKKKRFLEKLAKEVAQDKSYVDGKRKRIVFFSRGPEFMITFETLLALALKKMGVECIFVICDGLAVCNFSSIDRAQLHCESCCKGESIIRKLGFEVYRLSEFISDFENQPLPGTLKECKNYAFKGIPVGQLLLPSVLRYLLVSEIESASLNQAVGVYQDFIKAALQTYNVVSNIVQSLKPDKAMLFNGRYAQMRMAYETFSIFEIPCNTYESLNAPPGRYWIFSNSEPVMNLFSKSEWEKWKFVPCPEPFWSNYKRNRVSSLKLKLPKQVDAPFNLNKSILFLTNIRWELANIGLESVFNSMEECICETIKNFIETGQFLVVRIHPNDVDVYERDKAESLFQYLNKRFITFPENIWIINPEDKIDTYNLIDRCKRVVVWTSTIGMEMAYEGREPVVPVKANFTGKGFTKDVYHSKHAYFNSLLIENDLLTPERRDMAERYSSHFLIRKKIPLRLFEAEGSYDSSGFRIIKFSPHYKNYDPEKDEILKFVCKQIISDNGDFVLSDNLVDKTWDEHMFRY